MAFALCACSLLLAVGFTTALSPKPNLFMVLIDGTRAVKRYRQTAMPSSSSLRSLLLVVVVVVCVCARARVGWWLGRRSAA